MNLADGNTGAAGFAGVAEHGVPAHPVALAQPASEGAEVAGQADISAVAGFDGDEDAVVYVSFVASGEGHVPAIEGRPDRVPPVHGVVDGELVVGVMRLVTATVPEVAVGVLAPEVRHADPGPSRRDTVALVGVGRAAVLSLHPERGVGLPASPNEPSLTRRRGREPDATGLLAGRRGSRRPTAIRQPRLLAVRRVECLRGVRAW